MQNQIFESEKMDYLSIGDASEYLGISIDTLRRWEKKDRITAYRSPGGHRYFLKEDLKGLFNARYTRDTPTKRSKKEIGTKIQTEATKLETEKPEVEERVDAKHGIVIEEKSVFDPKFVDSIKQTEIVDWSKKYANKEDRKVRIPLIRPVAIRTSSTQTASNRQPIQQTQPVSIPVQSSQASSANTLVPPVTTQPETARDNQFGSLPVQRSVISPTACLPARQVHQSNSLSAGKAGSASQPIEKQSKIQKIAISVTLVVILISFIIFFYWYSQPRILSPIP